jgi:hypothetical protein
VGEPGRRQNQLPSLFFWAGKDSDSLPASFTNAPPTPRILLLLVITERGTQRRGAVQRASVYSSSAGHQLVPEPTRPHAAPPETPPALLRAADTGNSPEMGIQTLLGDAFPPSHRQRSRSRPVWSLTLVKCKQICRHPPQ